MDTDEHGNKPLHEDLLVTIAGPFQHLLIYMLLIFCTSFQLLPTSILDLIFFYNTVILLFNLLPIWPLDGGKILFLCLSYFLPYRKAHHGIILFSMFLSLCLLIGQIIFYPFTLSAFFIMIFLFMENRVEWKQRYYVFLRFLLKRYHGDMTIKGVQPIAVSNQATLMEVFAHFKRNKKHQIYISYPAHQHKIIDEYDCLRTYFYQKQHSKTIGEIGKEII